MPGATASAVAALAMNFHWDEYFIYRRLPLSRALQYLHCIAAQNPYIWTVSRKRNQSGAPSASVSLDPVALAAIASADSEVVLD